MNKCSLSLYLKASALCLLPKSLSPMHCTLALKSQRINWFLSLKKHWMILWSEEHGRTERRENLESWWFCLFICFYFFDTGSHLATKSGWELSMLPTPTNSQSYSCHEVELMAWRFRFILEGRRNKGHKEHKNIVFFQFSQFWVPWPPTGHSLESSEKKP